MTDVPTEVVLVKAGDWGRFVTAGFEVRPGTTDAAVLDEIWSENTYRWHALLAGSQRPTGEWDIADDDRIVVDVGANIGAFSILAALAGGAHVIAYEPDPANVEMFVRNLHRNGFVASEASRLSFPETPEFQSWLGYEHPDGGAVWIRPVAVGATNGYTALQTGLAGNSHVTGVFAALDPGTSLEGVVSVALGTELADPSVYVALLKIDVEGAELDVISGCLPDWVGRVGQIAMEYHGTMCAHITDGDEAAEATARIVGLLARTHAVELRGDPRVGGMLHANRY